MGWRTDSVEWVKDDPLIIMLVENCNERELRGIHAVNEKIKREHEDQHVRNVAVEINTVIRQRLSELEGVKNGSG